MVKTTSKVDHNIGDKIVSARIMRGLNRKELAIKLGITHQQLQKYEKGLNRISAARLLEIATILKFDINFFYADADKTPVLREESARYDSELVEEITNLARKVKSKPKIAAVKNLLKSLSDEG